MNTNLYTVVLERRYSNGVSLWEKTDGCSLRHAKYLMTLVGTPFVGGEIYSGEYYRTPEGNPKEM